MPSRGQFTVRAIQNGDVFGRLTVMSERQGQYVTCMCECGVAKSIRVYLLINGQTKSCGCLRRTAPAIQKRTHGYSKTPTYRSWCLMRSRCNNPNFPKYPRYGGRGIAVCERWERFENFLADMGPRPADTTLHRLDNDGDYSPGNCQWATTTDQARNKTTSRLLTFEGKTQSLADWADEKGINPFTLWNRIATYGWTVEAALTTPIQEKHFVVHPATGVANHKSKMIEHDGRTQNIAAWAREAGMSENNLRFRLKSMSISEALSKPVRKGIGGARQ